MRVAALILAYRFPAGVAALSDYFCRERDVDCFVHVDAKVDLAPFTTGANREAVFLSDRVGVFWRGFTMVEAMINLLEAAHPNYDRVVIISEDSLPLFSCSKMLEKLSSSGDWIAASLRNDSAARDRYDKFYMFDSTVTQVRWIPTGERFFTRQSLARMERLCGLALRGKKRIDSYYHGSQWMVLSREAVSLILNSWHNDQWLRESFEFSEVPDEAYFHTIVCGAQACLWRPLMHTNWNAQVPPRVFSSREEVLEELKSINEGQLFIRKVDWEKAALYEWINELCN